jgi:hypothetical protein
MKKQNPTVGGLARRVLKWSAALMLALTVSQAQAQISVGASGSSQNYTFDTTPPVGEFVTGVLTGTATTYSDAANMDAGAQTVNAANVVRQLPTTATQPPGTFSGGMRHNTAGFYIQSRPTTDSTNAAGIMVAKAVNNSGGDLMNVTLAYDFNMFNFLAGELPGFRVYWSATGEPGSWTVIPALSDSETVGRHSGELSLSVWAANAPLYILWADDNANSISDPGYTIDNLVLSGISTTITPITITTHPASTNVTERGTATFTVQASGSPQNFQWYRQESGGGGFTAIPGANSQSYTIPSVVFPGDNGAQFRVEVSNSLGTHPSAPATLTVAQDNTPPTIVSARGGAALNTIHITFSEPIDPTTLNEGVVNLFDPGTDPDNGYITFAVALTDGTNLTVTTEDRVPGQNYSLRVIGYSDDFGSGIRDASSALNPMITVTNEFLPQQAILVNNDATHEFKFYQEGSLDGSGWQTSGYDDSLWASGLNVLVNGAEAINANFGGTVGSTALTPPNGGGPNTHYFRTTFVLNALPTNAIVMLTNVIDDGAVFWVNGMEAGRVRMPTGEVNFATQANANPGEPVAPNAFQIPASVLIVGTNTLAIEVHQNGANSSDVVMGVRVDALINKYETGPATVVGDPQSLTVNEGQPASFSVVAGGAPPISYQWFYNGGPIAGANGPVYSINAALPSQAGNYHVVVNNGSGTDTSATATLTVIADDTPPSFLSAVARTNLTTVVLTFSEALDPNTALDESNYDIHLTAGGGNLGILAISIENGTNVVLTTTERVQGQNYTIDTANLSDASAAQNPVTPSSRPVISEIIVLAPDDVTQWRYEASSNNLDGITWQIPAYDDSAWLSGLAGFTTPTTEVTTNGFELRTTNMVAPNMGGPVTAYYRVPFNLPGSISGATLTVVGVIDDGAVFYINGVEAARLRMPTNNPISFTNLATAAGPETGDTHLPLDTVTLTNLSALASGPNLLAIELHQNSLTSSDAVLSIQLVAGLSQFSSVGSCPPVSISQNGSGQVTISWVGGSGCILQESNEVGPGASWSTSSRQNGVPFTPAGAMKFYRLCNGTCN